MPWAATMQLREPRPHSLSPRGLVIAGWLSLLVAGWIFFELAWDVASHTGLVTLDATVAAWLHAHGTAGLTTFMYAVTMANSIAATIAWSVILGVVLARLREWYWLLTLALAVGGGMILNVVLKVTYERARPHFDDPLVTLSTFSFPSGHTAGATLFYGVLAAFLVSRYREPRRRIACVLGAVLAIALVAFSRIYLGAHYLSDVIAAACSSTVWLVVCLSGVHALVRRRMREGRA
jgi:membrane-associated phospholipid phosphatase